MREAAFHDALVAGRCPEEAGPRAPDAWEQAILEAAQPVAGRAALDYGCGDGSLSFQLLDAGAARVTAIDLSPETIRFAQQRADRFYPGSALDFRVGAAETTGLPMSSFDLVVGKFVLHHLDLPAALSELHRLLAPGGRAVFIETSGLNPLLIAGRRHIVHTGRFGAQKVGTADEHPVTRGDLRLIRERFPDATVDFPIFWLWRLIARQLLAPRHPHLGHRVAALDQRIEERLPILRPLSYHMRIRFTKRG